MLPTVTKREGTANRPYNADRTRTSRRISVRIEGASRLKDERATSLSFSESLCNEMVRVKL